MTWENGNDISANQGDADFEIMKVAGSKYVILRKSIGYYSDLRFWEYFDGVKQAGLPIGAYHFFYPGYSVERQFAKFTEGINPSDLTFPPVLDVERRHTLSKTQAISDVLKMLYMLKSWWTGPRMPLIYTAKFVWQDFYSSKYGWIHDWDLLVANYSNADMPPYVPNGWTHTIGGLEVPPEEQFVAWQWEADGNNKGAQYGVSSDDIDMERMHKWYFDTFVSDTAPPTKPPTDPEPLEIEVVVPEGTLVTVTER